MPVGILLILAFLGIFWSPVLINWSRYCYRAYDLGIYAQALNRLSLTDLNPYLPIRSLHIFSDHFDPILILFAPLAKIIESSLAMIVVELGFILATALVLLAYIAKKKIDPKLGNTLILLFLMSTGTQTALHFPGHPGTWVVLPLILLAITMASNHRLGILLSAASLLLFKEESVPILGSLALYFGFRKRKDLALPLAGISIAGFVAIFWYRTQILTDYQSYSGQFLAPWKSDFFATLLQRLTSSGLQKVYLYLLLPFIPLLIWAKRTKYPINLGMGVAGLSYFLIRFVAGRWDLHYEIPVAACLIGLFLTSQRNQSQPPARTIWLTAMLVVACQHQYYGKVFYRTYFEGGMQDCPSDHERLTELQYAREAILERRGATIFASGILAPRLIEFGEVHHLETSTKINEQSGAFLLIQEKGPTGYPWPKSHQENSKNLNDLKSKRKHHALLEGNYVELVQFEPLTPNP